MPVADYGHCAELLECGSAVECRAFFAAGFPFPPSGYWVGGYCAPECELSRDCPEPDTGKAMPRCRKGVCRLDCSDDKVCPDKMNCFAVGEGPVPSELTCTWF